MPSHTYLDKNGKVIQEYDLLKVYHYTARLRRKKCYMYKYAFTNKINGLMSAYHLNGTQDYYCWPIKDGPLMDYEIIQSPKTLKSEWEAADA